MACVLRPLCHLPPEIIFVLKDSPIRKVLESTRRMKILIATFTYLPNLDGVSMASYFIARTFTDAGHQVRVATNGNKDSLSHVDPETGISVHLFQIACTSVYDMGHSGEVERYSDFLREYSPDIVFIQCWHTWHADLTMKHTKELGFRSVLISHGYVHHMIERPWTPPFGLRRWLKRRPLVKGLPTEMKNLDRMVFLSDREDCGRFFDVRIARRYGFENVSIIPNSVSISGKPDGTSFREKYGIGNKIMFFCPANYCRRKNQKLTLQCFVKAAIPNSCLVFVGSKLGKYGAELKAKWNPNAHPKLGMDVLFLEGIPRTGILDAFDASDVVLLTAYAETQPIVILESMAFGKPFVSTDIGCVRDFYGGMVESSKSHIVSAIRKLAYSPALRKELGNKGRKEYDDKYSPESVRSKWLMLLNELTEDDSDSLPS